MCDPTATATMIMNMQQTSATRPCPPHQNCGQQIQVTSTSNTCAPNFHHHQQQQQITTGNNYQQCHNLGQRISVQQPVYQYDDYRQQACGPLQTASTTMISPVRAQIQILNPNNLHSNQQFQQHSHYYQPISPARSYQLVNNNQQPHLRLVEKDVAHLRPIAYTQTGNLSSDLLNTNQQQQNQHLYHHQHQAHSNSMMQTLSFNSSTQQHANLNYAVGASNIYAGPTKQQSNEKCKLVESSSSPSTSSTSQNSSMATTASVSSGVVHNSANSMVRLKQSSQHQCSSADSELTNTSTKHSHRKRQFENQNSNESCCLKGYLTQLVLASNVPFAYTIILVAFLITMIAATSIITILTIVLTLTGYTAYPITENTFNTSLAIGVVCASFALALVTASLIVWRRHCQAAYYYLDEPQDASRATNSPQLSETYDDSEYGSILVNDWMKHVQKLHQDSDIGFSREFEQIQQSNQKQSLALSCDHSQLPENKHKNRYINIVAYDHTRVILKPPLGGTRKPGYDYINANFIDVSKMLTTDQLNSDNL